MDYEIVTLAKKTVVGLTARTKNSDADMGAIIGSLWQKLYVGGVYPTIQNKVNEYSIGLYSDYLEKNHSSEYSITAGCEVSVASNIPPDTIVKIIPAGKYAKFSVHGHMESAVNDFWNEFWKMNLDRSYAADFEEYLNADFENADINIFISLNN